MLRLENIKKDYVMKDSAVHALKGISLNFRNSEFVSILGPSGCGKTTLLNILGGLDQYTSGDLIIDGRSTKDFKDHDWDIYRNHRIGFIFQSYNLIPHENIEENVELALTIAGISKEERVKKARQALDRVGLKDMYKKKPNQLSGGQCQRVAIARALVNEPEILLADEPTGALDSTTSVQIMELIKEISQDKLVIMVTHNPDLAKKYSTRIVELLDGELTKDSHPYSKEEEEKERENGTSKLSKETEKAKMSWWTAFKLSSKNLISKAKRTALTIVAASIGIIGVSAVMSVSSGVTGYIDGMQDEMLSGNPIKVAKESFDLSSITSTMTTASQTDTVKQATRNGYVDVDFMTERLIESAKSMGSSMIENDITQDYVDFISEIDSSTYNDIVKNYNIDVTNNIYTEDTIDGQTNKSFSLSGITAIATSILENKLAKAGYSAYASTISSYSGTFSQSLNNKDYILSQYDVVKGEVATKADEIMIVLSEDEEITDFVLTLLGYYSQDEFLNIVSKFNDEDYDEALYQQCKDISYEKLMGKRFTYYPNNTVFTENTNETSKDFRPYNYSYYEDSSWTTGQDLKVVGILKPKQGRQYASLKSGFFYTPAFAEKFIKDNENSNLTGFINNYIKEQKEKGTDLTSYTSYIITQEGTTMAKGIYYTFDYQIEKDGDWYTNNIALVGSSNYLSSLSSLLGTSSNTGITTKSLSLNNIGGSHIPNSISFYPTSFDEKYKVTEYLDRWNSDEDIIIHSTSTAADGTVTVTEKTLTKDDREEIKYTDNLSVIIAMINNVINIVTIALISFTALSLVVSTVMIAIITYVSVMERIKEIGVIRALGGRKKDVSHLFNAETFIIGLLSGTFGIVVTYLLQLILNVIVHSAYSAITAIANLPFTAALIVILVSILLTTIAGLIPASSAARKDPVIALRTE